MDQACYNSQSKEILRLDSFLPVECFHIAAPLPPVAITPDSLLKETEFVKLFELKTVILACHPKLDF